jgi:hypothetical protein
MYLSTPLVNSFFSLLSLVGFAVDYKVLRYGLANVLAGLSISDRADSRPVPYGPRNSS